MVNIPSQKAGCSSEVSGWIEMPISFATMRRARKDDFPRSRYMAMTASSFRSRSAVTPRFGALRRRGGSPGVLSTEAPLASTFPGPGVLVVLSDAICLSAAVPRWTAPSPPDPARTQDRSVSGRRESDPRRAGVAPEGYLFQAAGAQGQLHPWAAPRQARAQKVTPRAARLVKPTRPAG